MSDKEGRSVHLEGGETVGAILDKLDASEANDLRARVAELEEELQRVLEYKEQCEARVTEFHDANAAARKHIVELESQLSPARLATMRAAEQVLEDYWDSGTLSTAKYRAAAEAEKGARP